MAGAASAAGPVVTLALLGGLAYFLSKGSKPSTPPSPNAPGSSPGNPAPAPKCPRGWGAEMTAEAAPANVRDRIRAMRDDPAVLQQLETAPLGSTFFVTVDSVLYRLTLISPNGRARTFSVAACLGQV